MADDSGFYVAAEKSDPSLIASTFNAFDARLKLLEKPKDTSLLEKVQKRGSFLTLIIGIVLSLVSLFNVFWSQPKEAAFRDMAEFNKSVNAVSNLRQNLIQVSYQSTNDEMKMALNSMVTPQVLANIQYATSLLPEVGKAAGVPQLIVLISEAINVYDWENAEKLVNEAVSRKSIPTLQSEALRYKGRLMFLRGRINEGRSAFEQALTAIVDEPGWGINGMRAYLVADWAVAEVSLGDCNSAEARAQQFIEFVTQPQIPAPTKAALIATFKSQMRQQNRCAMPEALSGLN
ncbi:hypothetical protein PspCFBP13508_08735 [Pseudomonas sp. CFBP13508]|uniref:hypothetical protein n=1 Tax=Pseudomonas sp. CFBP13508 TaxID=2184009 RepID=UPI0010C13674|nr:hypothetical protein [Pseudomonas sp. CFBP13508]TKJ72405.1 hypothetical protein PspCFBP13508_08735 [Pseudomonas sp. CFBP13508]